MDGQPAVCRPDTSIVVTGEDTCIGTDDQEVPCTRYGYRFDYAGAAPGAEIRCEATRRDPYRSRSKEYAVMLDRDSGSVLQPEWIPFSPVDRRTMLTEVHRCSYQDQPLATIEFIVSYEPDTRDPNAIGIGDARGPAPGVDEPYLEQVPGAWQRLAPLVVEEFLGTDGAQADGGNQHVPGLWSRCAYSSSGRHLGLVFKFMPYEMFDVDALNPMQLVFNVSMFAGASAAPSRPRRQLGKGVFAFDENGRSTVVMLTGLQGPMGVAGRAQELVAGYYLTDPSRPHEEKLALLLTLAEEDIASWYQP